ncbi:hypothetical protein BTVI_07281 [Pitangus sulphuratus]|nr:hypothetical protein BTVI_07281 [Pitangus sulphuratus]
MEKMGKEEDGQGERRHMEFCWCGRFPEQFQNRFSGKGVGKAREPIPETMPGSLQQNQQLSPPEDMRPAGPNSLHHLNLFLHHSEVLGGISRVQLLAVGSGSPKIRIPEWFGLKGTLKIVQFQPPAMGRDTFCLLGSKACLKKVDCDFSAAVAEMNQSTTSAGP